MRYRNGSLLAVVAVVSFAACSSGNTSNGRATHSASTPVASTRAVIRGTATLDGDPFDAEFIGAVIRRRGLVTPCQATLPAVTRGAFEISVMSATEASGCGEPGSEVLLWMFWNGKQYFSNDTVPWPANGVVQFDARFTTARPNGAARPRTEIAGEVFSRDGAQLGPGTHVEADIGETRCGVASVRTDGDFTGISMTIVGPDSVPGCERGATVHFRVNGTVARTTVVNNFGVVRSLRIRL